MRAQLTWCNDFWHLCLERDDIAIPLPRGATLKALSIAIEDALVGHPAPECVTVVDGEILGEIVLDGGEVVDWRWPIRG